LILNKLILYFHTVKHLKFIQIRYQLWNKVKSRSKNYFTPRVVLDLSENRESLRFTKWIDKPGSLHESEFTFLNLLKKDNNQQIEWQFEGFGKLWNYNLNYMDYLLQSEMSRDRGIKLIHNFIENIFEESTGLEPYPLSLRGINWVKFLTFHNVQDQTIDNSLFIQYKILSDNIEYHLLANHLLENGFSLLYGAFYFNDSGLYIRAKKIIEAELEEQILGDGGHYERSPMYHQIILERLLDSINLIQNNTRFSDQDLLAGLLKRKGVLMIRWLNSMTFSNGDIPMMNDSAPEIAPSTKQLNDYALRLGVITERIINDYPQQKINLIDSGYRRFNGSIYECIADVGHISPDYQPGHAHAGTFNFILYHLQKPVIVETGISTYEKNKRRQFERGTGSHNTVSVNNINSSGVWEGFRVARRAKITMLKEHGGLISAQHDGYKSVGFVHNRTFVFDDNFITITDKNNGRKKVEAIARIHLHPDVKFKLTNNILFLQGMKIEFKGHNKISLSDYLFASQFNVLTPSTVIEIQFINELSSTLAFN
jgi:hypothetical protein